MAAAAIANRPGPFHFVGHVAERRSGPPARGRFLVDEERQRIARRHLGGHRPLAARSRSWPPDLVDRVRPPAADSTTRAVFTRPGRSSAGHGLGVVRRGCLSENLTAHLCIRRTARALTTYRPGSFDTPDAEVQDMRLFSSGRYAAVTSTVALGRGAQRRVLRRGRRDGGRDQGQHRHQEGHQGQDHQDQGPLSSGQGRPSRQRRARGTRRAPSAPQTHTESRTTTPPC